MKIKQTSKRTTIATLERIDITEMVLDYIKKDRELSFPELSNVDIKTIKGTSVLRLNQDATMVVIVTEDIK